MDRFECAEPCWGYVRSLHRILLQGLCQTATASKCREYTKRRELLRNEDRKLLCESSRLRAAPRPYSPALSSSRLHHTVVSSNHRTSSHTTVSDRTNYSKAVHPTSTQWNKYGASICFDMMGSGSETLLNPTT